MPYSDDEMYGGSQGQGDLASRTITLEGKRFYLDVKENQRGRFIKIAEMSADGRKNQIMMTFSTAGQFHQNLTKFMEFYRGLGEVDSYNLKQGELKTEVMYKDDKKYHMDLKENARGRFLKVSETNAHSRFHVFIPADGMREFKQNIGELIEGFDTGAAYEGGDSSPSQTEGQSKHVRVENKSFYFDMKSNHQGKYLSISEVRGNYRNSILVPESGWRNVRDVLDEFIKEN